MRLYGTIRKGFTEEFLFDWILNDGQGRKDIQARNNTRKSPWRIAEAWNTGELQFGMDTGQEKG